jgi:hypothetical protein
MADEFSGLTDFTNFGDVTGAVPAPSTNFTGSGGLANILSQWGMGGAGSALPGTPAAPTGGGDWFSGLTKGLDKYLSPVAGLAKTISPLAGIASTGLGAAGSIMNMQRGATANRAMTQAMGTERQISQAALPEATKLTAAGGEAMLGGPIPEGIQAQVDAWKQKAQAEINSYLAHAGIADSTEMTKWQAYIDQQGYLMGQQLSSGLYTQGLQGLGVAGQGATGLSSSAAQMSAGVPSQISSVNSALAKLLAAQG